MLTPLKKHRGSNGGLIALGVLVTTTAVVWTTSPRDSRPVAATTSMAPSDNALKPSAQRAAPPKAPSSAAPKQQADRAPPSLERNPAIKTVVVGDRDFEPRITATGFATYDEDRTTHIGAPVAGWLQKVRTKSLGRAVKQGEVLGTIYSPEVYLASAELVKQVKDFTSQDDLNRERYRLLRWGMPRTTLDRIEQTLQPTGVLPLVVRYPGIVVAEQGERGQFVDPYVGREYFTVAPPGFAWAFVDVTDMDAPRIRVGSKATLTIQNVKRPLISPVAYVWKRGEDGMRKIRFDVYSPGMPPITPNAWVKAEIPLDRVRGPAVPQAAVIQMGAHTYVYVARDNTMQAREVKLGEKVAGFYRVADGLTAGDMVALGVKVGP